MRQNLFTIKTSIHLYKRRFKSRILIFKIHQRVFESDFGYFQFVKREYALLSVFYTRTTYSDKAIGLFVPFME